MASVLVPLAEGCEELEAVAIIDLLRRAGVEVVAAGLEHGPVRACRGVVLVPDTDLDTALQRDFDMVVLPGGRGGADRLEADPRIHALLRDMADRGRFTAAICAAPKVLASAGLLAGHHATSYPGVLAETGLTDVHLSEGAVVRDGRIVTSRGPGTAVDFALELIELLCGNERRREIDEQLVRT